MDSRLRCGEWSLREVFLFSGFYCVRPFEHCQLRPWQGKLGFPPLYNHQTFDVFELPQVWCNPYKRIVIFSLYLCLGVTSLHWTTVKTPENEHFKYACFLLSSFWPLFQLVVLTLIFLRYSRCYLLSLMWHIMVALSAHVCLWSQTCTPDRWLQTCCWWRALFSLHCWAGLTHLFSVWLYFL